jgi:hypothetical protein
MINTMGYILEVALEMLGVGDMNMNLYNIL